MKKDRNKSRPSITLMAIIAVVVICVLTGLNSLIFSLNYSQMVATAGLLFAVAAFYGVLNNMQFTTIQLRKIMAKPKIKVAFNEKGEQKAIIEYSENNYGSWPHPFIINEGTSVARYFQIDVIIPQKIGKYSFKDSLNGVKNVSFEDFDNDNYILTYINDGKPTLFIDKPYSYPAFSIESALDHKKCIELSNQEKDITLKYKIFGDWGEPQESELEIILKKQEVLHAPG